MSRDLDIESDRVFALNIDDFDFGLEVLPLVVDEVLVSFVEFFNVDVNGVILSGSEAPVLRSPCYVVISAAACDEGAGKEGP